MSNEKFISLLNEQLSASKVKNHSYSLRAFAKKLNVQPSALSEILNGKRKVTISMQKKIMDALDLDPSIRAEILGENLFQINTSKKKIISRLLTEEEFSSMNSWIDYCILTLLTFENLGPWTSEKLISKISASEAKIQSSLKQLQKLGFITYNQGVFKRAIENIRTSDGISSEAIKNFHFDDLNKIKENLEASPIEFRDSSSISLSMNPKSIPAIRKMIREFQEKINFITEQEIPTDVYRLSIHLHPLTKPKRSPND